MTHVQNGQNKRFKAFCAFRILRLPRSAITVGTIAIVVFTLTDSILDRWFLAFDAHSAQKSVPIGRVAGRRGFRYLHQRAVLLGGIRVAKGVIRQVAPCA